MAMPLAVGVARTSAPPAQRYCTDAAGPSRVESQVPAARPAALVFVHLSKAGGSSLKNVLVKQAAREHEEPPVLLWRLTWPALLEDCRRASPTMCNRSLYMGTGSYGACDVVMRRPCHYFTQLREPIARMQSHYSYFCVAGAEGRKGWDPGWRRCELSLEGWAARHRLQTLLALTQPFASVPTRNGTRASPGPGHCNCTGAGCAAPWQEEALLNEAKRSIRTGAMVALVLEEPAESARLLLQRLQLDLSGSGLLGAVHINSHGNHSASSARDIHGSLVPSLSALLRHEIALYEYARGHLLNSTAGP